MKFIMNWFLSAAGLIVIAKILETDGFYISGFFTALIAALIIGLLNISVRPILWLITLPINILTFGLFNFVLTTIILFLASWFVGGFYIGSFFTGIFAAVLLTIWNIILDKLLRKEDK